MSLFRYTNAIVRRIPTSFRDQAVRRDGTAAVDLTKSETQFNDYVHALKDSGVEVLELEADETLPDCPFVEDAAVVIGSRAFITRPSLSSRRREVKRVRDALKNTLKVNTFEVTDPNAVIDGGDVLFTGREILVGESERTNQKGIKALAETFTEYSVTSIPVKGPLHLKSIATMAWDDVILVSGSIQAKPSVEKMKSDAKYKYKFLEVETDVASNVVLVNGHVFHKTCEEVGKASYDILKSHLKGKLREMMFTEFYKVEGCFTCCSLLINLPQNGD